MKWLEDILNNKPLMRNIRFGFAITLSLALGLLYFGWVENFELKALLNIGVGLLGIIGFISWLISWLEVSELAQGTECDENDEIIDVTESIDSELKKLDYENEDVGIEFVEEYNRVHQDKANNKITQKEIQKLQNKIRKRKYDRKPYDDLQREVDFLRENPLFDKKFKPILHKHLFSLNNQSGFTFKKENENIDLGYTPKNDGALVAVVLGLFKMVGLGLNAAIPFIIEDWRGLIVYYVMLIIWILTSSSKRYITVRYKTATKYLDKLRNQERLIKEVSKRTTKREVSPTSTKKDKTDKNSSDNKNVSKVVLEVRGANNE